MRRPVLLVVALAAAVAIMAVRLAPPSIVDVRLAQITSGNLRLGDAEGTVWDGRGILIAGAERIPIAWRIDAWSLVRGELTVHLVSAAAVEPGSPRAFIDIRGGRFMLRDVNATLPAGFLGVAAGFPAAWAVGGDLGVTATAFEWAPPANRGEARLRWRAARLIPPGGAVALDLGDVSLTLTGEGDAVSGPILNTGGELGIRGDIALRAGGAARISLVLTPRRADNRGLAQALSALGTPEGDGWRVDWRLPLQ